MSLMNGLNTAGAAMSQYFGSAGLEAQKADLQQKSLLLADQLATTRESAGRVQAGDIAAKAASNDQAFRASQTLVTEGGATDRAKLAAETSLNVANIGADTSLKTANISAASAANTATINAASSKYSADLQSKSVYAQLDALEPGRQAEVLRTQQQTALAAVQTQAATELRGLHGDLSTEMGKPAPDPDRIKTLKSQIVASETSAQTEAATNTAASMVYKTDLDAVQSLNKDLTTATTQLNQMAMGDDERKAQKALVDNLQKQLNGANISLANSSKIAHGRVNDATGTTEPSTAPPLPPGVPDGSSYSATLKLYRSPTGLLFDVNGKPATAPSKPGAAGSLINGTSK